MNIPKVLIFTRFLFGLIILALAYFIKDDAKIYIVILMYLGLLSDIFDGIIARQQGLSTEALRRWDSQVDLVFWLCIGIATWMLYPEVVKNHRWAIISIFILEALCYAISILKFGKETCTHAYLSKLWGISLVVAFTSLLALGHDGKPFNVSIVLGIVSQLDVILIILILNTWTHDIPSSYHAFLIRNNIPFKKYKLFNSHSK